MDFNVWYDINPIKDKIDGKFNSNDLKKLTPVLIDSDLLIKLKEYYAILNKKHKFYMIPSFLLKQFAVNHKGKFYTIFPFYELEKEIDYLIKNVPTAEVLKAQICTLKKDYDLILKNNIKFFSGSFTNKISEVIRVIDGDKIVGFKAPQKRP